MSNLKTWTTKSGEKIRIKDMTDAHLLNTIAFLERQTHTAHMTIAPPMFNGEIAQLYADEMYADMMDSGPEYFYPLYEDLVEEADRRQLSRSQT